MLKPFTRDTFSSCIKACDAIIDGKEYPIFKDPKTDRDTGNGFKKSQKGCCVVYTDETGELYYEDERTWDEACKDPNNRLKPVFRNGKMLKDYTLAEVRDILNGGKF